jgi:hypothetical protein
MYPLQQYIRLPLRLDIGRHGVCKTDPRVQASGESYIAPYGAVPAVRAPDCQAIGRSHDSGHAMRFLLLHDENNVLHSLRASSQSRVTMLGLQSRILLWYATHACIVARLAWPLSGEGCLRKKRSRPRRKYATIDFEHQATIPASYC